MSILSDTCKGTWMSAAKADSKELESFFRETNSAIYHVFEGRRHSVINGVLFDWQRGDFFVVPPWAWHEFVNESKEEAILFSVQDTPVMQALGSGRNL